MTTHRHGAAEGSPARSRTLVRALPKRGLCSRTQAFGLIRSGGVMVNGRAVTDPNRVIRAQDRIMIAGADAAARRKRYILFYKPAGCVTTRHDERGRKTVYDVLGDVGDWVFPVGRLDKDTEGLLLFTNDTAFGDYLTDPVNRVERTYRVTVAGNLSGDDIAGAGRGVDIGRGERSRPLSIEVMSRDGPGMTLEIVLVAGKNREIRRLCEALGAPVERLVRTKYGPFELGRLEPGARRELDGRACAALCSRNRKRGRDGQGFQARVRHRQ